MTGRTVTAIIAVVLVAGICGVGGLLGLAGAAAACSPHDSPTDVAISRDTTANSAAPTDLATYDREQLDNAATIVAVGAGRGVAVRGLTIAVATALQESSLRNLADRGGDNDHDSLGLFQQRPSKGWGTAEQISDPAYAANAFYDRLLKVRGWQLMPLTQVAQAVQHSAYPDAYAKWEPDATTLVSLSYGLYAACNGGDGMSSSRESLPAGFVLPAGTPVAVAQAIFWAIGQLGTPYAFGGSCTDPHSGNRAEQCDCSSLIQQAYRNGGITLPRLTDDQQNVGTPVAAIADLLPGDLIFIPGFDGTMTDPGHVGMYIGSGLLIQAPHTGDVVKLTNVVAWSRVASIRRVVV